MSEARSADYDALARAAPIDADVAVSNEPPAACEAILDAVRAADEHLKEPGSWPSFSPRAAARIPGQQSASAG